MSLNSFLRGEISRERRHIDFKGFLVLSMKSQEIEPDIVISTNKGSGQLNNAKTSGADADTTKPAY